MKKKMYEIKMNISKKYKKLRPKPKLSQCTQKLWITENYRRSLKSMGRPKPNLSQLPQKLRITENYQRPLTSRECLNRLYQADLLKTLSCYFRPTVLRMEYLEFKTEEMCVKAVDANPYYLECVPDRYITQKMCDRAVDVNPWCFRCVPDRYITQEMCVKAVDVNPYYLKYVPDCFKTQEMCANPYYLKYVPDCFKSQEMCVKVVDANPYSIKYVPDCFKIQEMCVKVFNANPYSIKYVPDCFITQEMIENGGRCYDSCCDSCDEELHEWFNGYNERKAQKAQIKAELLPIAWHPDRVIDWCFDEEEKKDLMRLWGSVDL